MARFVNGEADLAKELREAKDIFVILDFTASWCGPCKMIAPTFESLAAQYAGKGVFLKIDADANRPLVSKYAVQGFPTFIALRDGVELDRFSGADAEKLTRIVAAAAVVPRPPEPRSPFSFPLRGDDVFFDGGDAQKVCAFVEKKSKGRLGDDEEKLQTLPERLLSGSEIGVTCRIILAILKWEEETQFAGFDLLRLLLLSEAGCAAVKLMEGTSPAVWPEVFAAVRRPLAEQESRAVAMRRALAFECLANGIRHNATRELLGPLLGVGLENTGSSLGPMSSEPRAQGGVAALLLNTASAAWRERSLMWAEWTAAQIPLWLSETAIAPPALARFLGAIGTLVWLAHVQANVGNDWDCTHAVVLSSLALPADAPPKLASELSQCFQLALQ